MGRAELPHRNPLALLPSKRMGRATGVAFFSPALRSAGRLADLLRRDCASVAALAEEHALSHHVDPLFAARRNAGHPAGNEQLSSPSEQRLQTFFTLRLNAELFRAYLSNSSALMELAGYHQRAGLWRYGTAFLLLSAMLILRNGDFYLAGSTAIFDFSCCHEKFDELWRLSFCRWSSLSAIDAGKFPAYLFSKPDFETRVALHNDFTACLYFPRAAASYRFFRATSAYKSLCQRNSLPHFP